MALPSRPFFSNRVQLMAAYLLTLFVFHPSPYAARPMITDDARIVDPKSCQLESWVKRSRERTEYWALPGCNFTGNLELSFGGARSRDAAEGIHTSDVIFQAKTLFKTLEPNGWAWGLAFGNIQHPATRGDRHGSGDRYGYVPASFSFLDDQVVVHTNLGWLYEQSSRQHFMTAGIGSETRLGARTWLIAETFGQNESKAFYQIGFRYWLLPNHVQLDTTYGNRFGSRTDERWMSVGFRLLSPAFLR